MRKAKAKGARYFVMSPEMKRAMGSRYDGDDRDPLPPTVDMGQAVLAWWFDLKRRPEAIDS
jgi:hypothetical protein